MKLKNYLDLLSDDIRLVDVGGFFKELSEREKVPFKKIAAAANIPYRSLMNYIDNKRSTPLYVCKRIIKSTAENEFDILFDKLFDFATKAKSESSKSEEVLLPKIFTSELAYLIGAIHDGTVYGDESKNQFVVQYWQFTDTSWLDKISEMLNKVFGTKPKRYENYIQLSNKAVFEFFRKVIKVPQKQCSWNSILSGLPWHLQKHIIAGFFDAEGWCGTKDDLRLKMTQKNPDKLLEIKAVLELNGINTGNLVKENEAFSIYLCGKSCIMFIEQIGILSKHKAKIEKFSLISG